MNYRFKNGEEDFELSRNVDDRWEPQRKTFSWSCIVMFFFALFVAWGIIILVYFKHSQIEGASGIQILQHSEVCRWRYSVDDYYGFCCRAGLSNLFWIYAGIATLISISVFYCRLFFIQDKIRLLSVKIQSILILFIVSGMMGVMSVSFLDTSFWPINDNIYVTPENKENIEKKDVEKVEAYKPRWRSELCLSMILCDGRRFVILHGEKVYDEYVKRGRPPLVMTLCKGNLGMPIALSVEEKGEEKKADKAEKESERQANDSPLRAYMADHLSVIGHDDGWVFAGLQVGADGSVSNVRITESLTSAVDKTLLNVLQSMKIWRGLDIAGGGKVKVEVLYTDGVPKFVAIKVKPNKPEEYKNETAYEYWLETRRMLPGYMTEQMPVVSGCNGWVEAKLQIKNEGSDISITESLNEQADKALLKVLQDKRIMVMLLGNVTIRVKYTDGRPTNMNVKTEIRKGFDVKMSNYDYVLGGKK